MGKLVHNSIIGDAKGKIGDLLIADTKYGPQVKELPGPHLIIPPGQLQEMEYWSFVSNAYDQVTEQEAGWWRLWASYPYIRRLYTKSRHLEGRNMFFAVNMKRIEIGEPVILSIPHFENAQLFERIDIELVNKRNKKELVLNFSPVIKENTKLIITATGGVKENLLKIDAAEYKKIAILDSSFKSGRTLSKQYLELYKDFPEEGLKIGFKVSSVNRECGTQLMLKDIRIHQFTGDKGKAGDRKYIDVPPSMHFTKNLRKGLKRRDGNAR